MTPALHRRFPELASTLPHTPLGGRPTVVRRLPAPPGTGTEVWLKQDGAFGDGGWGGNKVRKLEWLLPEAQRRGRGSILTFGGLGTNWGLATALYGGEAGLDVALALLDQPVDDHVRAQLERLRASGAHLHFTHTKPRTVAALPWLLARHMRGGRPPYLLPSGGSSPVGALGYVEAALEIADQVAAGGMPAPRTVVVPVGSGGTVAGLHLGLRLAGLTETTVVGVVVNDMLRLDHPAITRLATRAADLLRARGARFDPALPADRLVLETRWLGPGYGHPTDEGAAAQAWAAEHAGLHLDPVYNAKAVAGLLGLASDGRLGDGPVLYVHTDGPR